MTSYKPPEPPENPLVGRVDKRSGAINALAIKCVRDLGLDPDDRRVLIDIVYLAMEEAIWTAIEEAATADAPSPPPPARD